MQTEHDTPREKLRQALVGLAKARAHAGSIAGIKGPEAGEPASGKGPSEFPGGHAPRHDTAALSEGREET